MSDYTLNAYLRFNGEAEAALNFYHSVFGGEVTISRYGDNDPNVAEEHKNSVMHGDLKTDKLRLMVSDSGPMGKGTKGTNFSLSLSGTDAESLRGFYEKLSNGGDIAVPLAPSPWGDEFAMFSDSFGIMWMVNITKE